MTNHLRSVALLALLTALPLFSQTPASKPTQSNGSAIPMSHAKGTFDVKATPAPGDDKSKDSGVGRFLLDKQFHGDLDAHSVGVMLAAGNPATGSAGYVAMETVTGTLTGHSGSFSLQQSGIMDKGALSMTVTVVPGTGTGELAGISGTMQIIIADGKHSYDLAYSLPPKP
jgi:hypothetical protein